MSDRSCPKCGGSDLETDPGRGDVHCTNCGLVLDEATIVSEVQFQEGRSGGCHVVGQTVTGGGSVRGGNSVGGFFGLSSRESRQVTLDNAERRIKEVAAQIRLNNSGISVAHNIYKRALQKRLTHGRKNTHVIAACVYMACRLDSKNNSIMLLDLSDTMQVNVYELGRTYLKLSSALHINIPTIDPCIYIIRYIHQLPNLADHKFEIESTAMRITKRMKRDWMHFGRRPSGLCGAAILVASRLHGIHCGVEEIIKVVKVCEATIRKRLNEFGDTPTSRLTLEQFMSVDLEGEEDPPCFKSARKKMKAVTEETRTGSEETRTGSEDIRVVTEGDLASEEVIRKVTDLEELIEKELEKVRAKKRGGRFAAYAKMAGVSSESPTVGSPNPSSSNPSSSNPSSPNPPSSNPSKKATTGSSASPIPILGMPTPRRTGLRSRKRTGSYAEDDTESFITDFVMNETIETLNQVIGEEIFPRNNNSEEIFSRNNNSEEIFPRNNNSNQSLITHSINCDTNSNQGSDLISTNEKLTINESIKESINTVSINAMETTLHTETNVRKLSPNLTSGQLQASSKPEEDQLQTSSKPEEDQLQTSSKAEEDQLQTSSKAEEGTLFFDDLDDSELDSYILDETEAWNKGKLWETIHSDWLKESALKAAKKAEEEEEARIREGGDGVKKKRKVKKKVAIQANSTGEAVEKMLQEKKLSNKINYAALNIIEPKSSPLASVTRGNRMVNVTPINVSSVTPINVSSVTSINVSNVTPINVSNVTFSTPDSLVKSDLNSISGLMSGNDLNSTSGLMSENVASASIRSTPMKNDTPAFKRLPSLKSFVPVRSKVLSLGSTVLSRARLRAPLKGSLSPTKSPLKVSIGGTSTDTVVDKVTELEPSSSTSDEQVTLIGTGKVAVEKVTLEPSKSKEPVLTVSDEEEENQPVEEPSKSKEPVLTVSDEEEEDEDQPVEETQLSITQLMSARAGAGGLDSDHETDMDYEPDY